MFSDILSQLDWTQIILFAMPAIAGALVYWYRTKRAQIAEIKGTWGSIVAGLRTIPTMSSDLSGIKALVAPNGGGSLFDMAKRTEERVATLAESLDLVVQTSWAENDTDEEVGRFHSSAGGDNTYVNQTYARWLAVGKLDLLGWNFLNYIHPADVDRVREHWDQCRAENRQFRSQYRMVGSSGETITVRVTATPIPERLPAKRWIGSIQKVVTDALANHQ